jgi:hypothetical protein
MKRTEAHNSLAVIFLHSATIIFFPLRNVYKESNEITRTSYINLATLRRNMGVRLQVGSYESYFQEEVASFVYGGEGIRMNNDLLIERMIS